MMVKGSSHIAQTHNTHIKMVNELTEHVKKFHLKTVGGGGGTFYENNLLALKITGSHVRNYWWLHSRISDLVSWSGNYSNNASNLKHVLRSSYDFLKVYYVIHIIL
jgi:hypothetical protein